MSRLLRIALVAALIGMASAVPPCGAATASPQLASAQACRHALTLRTKQYADRRFLRLTGCLRSLLKCELRREVGNPPTVFNYSTCRAVVVAEAHRGLGAQFDSYLNKQRRRLTDSVAKGCGAMLQVSGFAAILSNGPGGLWYANDRVCGSAPDLPALVDCMRGRLDHEIDTIVGIAIPRGGVLLDDIGLGAQFPDLPRPPTMTRQIAAAGGALTPLDTIPIPKGQSITFTGDSSTLPCDPSTTDGTITIKVGTGTCPNNFTARQALAISEPYGPDNIAVFGPFNEDLQYCIARSDGGGCGDSLSGTIDVDVPTTVSTTQIATHVLNCEKKLVGVLEFLQTFESSLQRCTEAILQCELAEEIDAGDKNRCLTSLATTAKCFGTTGPKRYIEKVLTPTAFGSASTYLFNRCSRIPMDRIEVFMQGLGFSALAGCSTAADIREIAHCMLGDLGPTGAYGVKCAVEHNVSIRDPRAKHALEEAAIALDPTNNFPCLGP